MQEDERELLRDTHGLQQFRSEKIPSAVRGGAQIEAVCDVLGADFREVAWGRDPGQPGGLPEDHHGGRASHCQHHGD